MRYTQERIKDRTIYQRLARGIAYLQRLYPISSVADIGCNCGAMLSYITCENKVGIDYDINTDLMLFGFKYHPHDLRTFPVKYTESDLIICQETIEHIDSKYESNVLEMINLNSSPFSILVFSGAEPGQRGRHHVNCQTKAYWKEKLEDYGFYYSRHLTRKYRKYLPKRSCYYSNTIVCIKSKMY